MHRRALGQAGWVTHLVIGGGALLLVCGHTPSSDQGGGHGDREGRAQALCWIKHSEGLVTRYSAQSNTEHQQTAAVIL